MQISVIVPTHNRADALRQTLAHLARQEFAETWETIVVNNNSTDETDAVATAAQKDFPVELRLIHEKTPGAAAARNAGANRATGEYLIFIDNDILVAPDFLHLHFKTLRAHPGCWFIGRVKNPPELRETAFGRYRDDLDESNFVNLPVQGLVDFDGATGANWAMSKSEFVAAEKFDENYSIASCEDAELALRAREKGFRTMFNPQSVVIHNDWAIDLETYCRRQELYSISTVLLWQKYGRNSFQLETVEQNAPLNWKNDSARIIAKKIVKAVVSSAVGFRLTKTLCKSVERFAPDTSVCRRAYKTAIALAIFRGVREGFKRYVNAPGKRENRS